MSATETVSARKLQHDLEEKVSSMKAELEDLVQKRDALKSAVEAIQLRSNQEVDKKHLEARTAMDKVYEERAKLDADKREFEGILSEFKKEKASFEREKQVALDMKENARVSIEQVGRFIRIMRDEAARL